MEWFFFWFAAAVVVGIIAKSRGRVGFAWFILAMVITPLLAGILVLALRRQDQPAMEIAPTAETHRHCPECREIVRRDARKCKHCGSALTPI